ncbi:MAG: PQQ-like beta-propeller repeat protein, partial [Phycisphaerae bacterium]|nr:PQQ-like beta-propeller repeat protein [Phycisphaerae bacterium]
MRKKILIATVALIACVGVASAQYHNDFSTLDGIGGGSGTPYLDYGDTAVSVDDDGGYGNITQDPGAVINVFNGTITFIGRLDSGTASGMAGVWLRLRDSSNVDAGYFLEVPINGGWTTVTAEIESPNYDNGFDPTTLNFVNVNPVIWDHTYTLSVDDLDITYEVPPSDPPTADAGADQNISLGLCDPPMATLDGSGSYDDFGVTRYVWKLGGTVLSDSADPTVTVELPLAGATVSLTVYDADLQQDTDTVDIAFTYPALDAPIADAGPDRSELVPPAAGVELDASGSVSDCDLTYAWYNVVDPLDPEQNELLVETTDAVTTVLLPEGLNILDLVVTDAREQTDTDRVEITVTYDIPVIDDIWGPFGVKRGDIYGTGQHPFVVPTENVALSLMHQRTGLPDPTGDRQFVFDAAGNFYFVTWYGSVKSLKSDLSDHWETADLIGTTGENGMIVVGNRSVYVVGAAQGTNIGTVWALSLIDGTVEWTTPLGETWPNNDSGRGLMTLYNDKLYVTGVPTLTDNVADPMNIYQINATTGAIDWTDPVMVGAIHSMPGHLLFVPDVYGTGLHGLFISARSEGEADGLSDTNAIEIDPSSGATLVWGIDAGAANHSRMIYSDAAGRDAIYAVTDWDWAGKQFWSFDLNTGGWDLDGDPGTPITPAGIRGGDYANGQRGESAVLSYDGMSVYCGNDNGRVYKYTDDGTGQNLTAAEYWFGIDEYDARAAAPLSVLMLDGNGDEILVTSLGEWRWWNVDPNDPTNDRRDNSTIALLNMSTATIGGSEAELDDGPIYIDNVVVTVNGSPVETETFESYSEGTFPPAGDTRWAFTGTAGTEVTARIVDLGAPHGKVLELNPYGGNSYDETEVTLTLPGVYNDQNYDLVVYSWDEYRTDLSDNLTIGDEYAMFQWDGAGDPASQIAWSLGVSPEWSLTANVAVGAWEACTMTVDYGYDLFDMTVAGTNNGETPPFLSVDGLGIEFKDTDEMVINLTATPPTSSGYVRQPDVPLAEYTVSSIIDPVTFEQDWGYPDGLSVAPNGDIYFMQFKGYARRYTHLRITGDSGVAYKCGDADGDGSTDVFDIDAFVYAITHNEA